MPKKIKIKYQRGAKELAVSLLGRAVSDEDLAAAAGALAGASLTVRPKRYQGGMELFVEIKDDWIEEQQRGFRRDSNGDLYIWNHIFKKARDAPKGIGLRSVVTQIAGARRLSVKRLEMFAQGHLNDREYNGYFRWAIYGYDAPLTASEQHRLSRMPKFAGASTINELILRGGREWWKERGSARKMIFDPSPDSSMMTVLTTYLQQVDPELLKELI